MSFPLFDRNRLVHMGIVKKKVRRIEKRPLTQVVHQRTINNENQDMASRFEASSQVIDSHYYSDKHRRPESSNLATNSINQLSSSNYLNTKKWRKPIISIKNHLASRNSPLLSKYSSPSPVSHVNKGVQFSKSPATKKKLSQCSRSSNHYTIPKMTQSAFDQILPLSTPKRQSKGGKLSLLLGNVIREKQYQTTVSRLLSFSGDDYFEQQEYSVEWATLRSSYSAWGTQVIQVSDSTSIAVREKEVPIVRQPIISVLNQSKQVFRLVSSPIKVDSIDGRSIVGGYVKI